MAGIEVARPDVPGAKSAQVKVVFGSDGKKTVYHLSQQPVTLQILATGGNIAFDGSTQRGIRPHIEAVCFDVEQV